MATTIYLIRTGQTTWEAEGRVPGGVDVPLTETGKAVTAATAEALKELKPAALYYAPDAAAKTTARIIAKKLHTRAKSLKDLADIDFGLWQGMRWSEVEKRHPKAYRKLLENPLSVAPPEGEPVANALRRIRKILQTLAERHREEVIALVCSAGICGLVRACVESTSVPPPLPSGNDQPPWCLLHLPGPERAPQ